MSRPLRRLPLVLALAAGCRTAAPAVVAPPPETLADIAARTWSTTRSDVIDLQRRGDHDRADSLLTQFRARYPGTPSAAEALFRRALLRADPATNARTWRGAVSDFEAYESGGPLHPFLDHSVVYRRLLGQADSLRAAAAAERTAASVLIPRDSLRPRDEEIARLRTELEQTRAALDRVLHRLAPPPRP
ncbi:hypothetical protein [Roseisolibacter sp. H3M3-2]|uniref:tetratricopeptide repeat protein n=1 Tax=Roseisolibacter sp. H3M3-2 TaxID=3031323 RepID=UPI0023D97B8D|nr:hypothetical protein [Roseisolibacter sp. H3M3-2]MDF1503017.1 hypothetical protein [Roseisolibacter sp. H3M3-2]